MSDSDTPDTGDPKATADDAKAVSLTAEAVKRAATRAAAKSMKLENRDIPTGYVRSDGVKRLLAEREARKH